MYACMNTSRDLQLRRREYTVEDMTYWPCRRRRRHLLAVQTAKTICSESKKRNMTRSDTDAPIGRNIA